jgi:hypothetical protein
LWVHARSEKQQRKIETISGRATTPWRSQNIRPHYKITAIKNKRAAKGANPFGCVVRTKGCLKSKIKLKNTQSQILALCHFLCYNSNKLLKMQKSNILSFFHKNEQYFYRIILKNML